MSTRWAVNLEFPDFIILLVVSGNMFVATPLLGPVHRFADCSHDIFATYVCVSFSLSRYATIPYRAAFENSHGVSG